MRSKTFAATLAAAAISAAAFTAPGQAATAHNSQAGAWGPTTNNCAPTPYFPAGSCLGSVVQRWQEDEVYPPPYDGWARYHPRPPLQ